MRDGYKWRSGLGGCGYRSCPEAVCRTRSATGAVGVTSFKIQYKTAAGAEFQEFDTTFRSVDSKYLEGSWKNDTDQMFKAFFPKVIAARYIRFVVETFVGRAVMRADVLPWLSNDMFSGKHLFRRCLETDRFTRIVQVPPLSIEEARGFRLPKHFVKSIECPGCYQCRELPIVRNYGWDLYNTGGGQDGFHIVLCNASSANAVLTVSLPTNVKSSDGTRLTWGAHNPEFICKIDPSAAGPGPADPDLIDDEAWTTFLPAVPEDQPTTEDAIVAIANGFFPPEAVRDFESKDRSNLAAIYPPGQQLDPTVAAGPYYSRDWHNLSAQADEYTVPSRTLDGDRGGYWPPKPTIMVTFMPSEERSSNAGKAFYPQEFWGLGKIKFGPWRSAQKMESIREQAIAMGWNVDTGAADADHTHSVTGETLTVGDAHRGCHGTVGVMPTT